MVYNMTYFGLHKLYKMSTTQIASWTSICLLYKTKNMSSLRKNVHFYAKRTYVDVCKLLSCQFPSMAQYVDLLKCHTPHKVDTLAKMLSTYSWLNMSTCRHATPHKVDTVTKMLSTYPWFNMCDLLTCHTPIRSTLWLKCSIHIHDSICQPVDMSHTP